MCSACYSFLLNIRDPEKLARVLIALGIAEEIAEMDVTLPIPPPR